MIKFRNTFTHLDVVLPYKIINLEVLYIDCYFSIHRSEIFEKNL